MQDDNFIPCSNANGGIKYVYLGDIKYVYLGDVDCSKPMASSSLECVILSPTLQRVAKELMQKIKEAEKYPNLSTEVIKAEAYKDALNLITGGKPILE